jgi:hypothetical protein
MGTLLALWAAGGMVARVVGHGLMMPSMMLMGVAKIKYGMNRMLAVMEFSSWIAAAQQPESFDGAH